MKTLYFDCFAGASGNMILGGLVSLGLEPVQLVEEIRKLNISGFDIRFSDVDRSGIGAVHAETIYQDEKAHRHLSHIEKIIRESDLTDSVKRRAILIFTKLAEAEAKVHGVSIEKVHFHEVGAMDAIIDVVGACIGFGILGIEKFVCSKIHTGSGFIEIAHGKYPVPPPAVAELLNGIPSYSTGIEGELITPTGAAIISTLCEEFGAIDGFSSEKIGYGAGTREYENFPNVLRLMIGEISSESAKRTANGGQRIAESEAAETKDQKPNTEDLLLIETNLDDISPEILGFVMEKAFDKGAFDCWFTPIQMKKNRPSTMLSILCDPADKDVFAGLLYTETSTLGVRVKRIERECLPRETRTVATKYGDVEVKTASYNGRIVNAKPEFEQLKKIAQKENVSLSEIEKLVLRNFENSLEERKVAGK
ncbi:MAG: nickel pincer cofactor biosynthesis protein LarC [Pyrinomonadaceae bacterium]